MSVRAHPMPWFLVPLVFPFLFVGWVLKLTGRFVGALLGSTLLMLGIVLSLSVVGAIAGIPIAFLGILLMIRSLF
ncbi:MAG TPA: hypothetical protein VF947_08825 [Myxococcales bacterium]